MCVKPLEEHVHIHSHIAWHISKNYQKRFCFNFSQTDNVIIISFSKVFLRSWPYDCGKTRIRPVYTRVSGWWAGDCACSERPLWHQDPNNSLRHGPRWEHNHPETWGHSTAGPKSDGTQEIPNIRYLLQMTSYQGAVIRETICIAFINVPY